MERSRFDVITRDLAVSTSRRQAVKLFGGAVVGGVLALGGARSAAAAACKGGGKKCKAHKDCCNVCCDGVCCEEGSVCLNGACVASGGPNLLRCFCQDTTQFEICGNVDCDSGLAQDAVCGPLCEPHGGLAATGCGFDDVTCAA